MMGKYIRQIRVNILDISAAPDEDSLVYAVVVNPALGGLIFSPEDLRQVHEHLKHLKRCKVIREIRRL